MKKSSGVSTPLLVGLSFLFAGAVYMVAIAKDWSWESLYPALIFAFFFPLVIGLLIQVSCLRSRVEELEELVSKTEEAGEEPLKENT